MGTGISLDLRGVQLGLLLKHKGQQYQDVAQRARRRDRVESGATIEQQVVPGDTASVNASHTPKISPKKETVLFRQADSKKPFYVETKQETLLLGSASALKRRFDLLTRSVIYLFWPHGLVTFFLMSCNQI